MAISQINQNIRRSLTRMRRYHNITFDPPGVNVAKYGPNLWLVKMSGAQKREFYFEHIKPTEFRASMGSAIVEGGVAGVAGLVEKLLYER